MLKPEELLLLQNLPLVEGLPEETRRRVAALLDEIGERQDLQGGEVLFLQGGLGGDSGFVLLNGGVMVEREGESPVPLAAPVLLGEMHQLNPRAQRTATVRAQGPGATLKFSWREFYAHAKELLSPKEQALCMKNIELLVLERFHQEMLMDLPMMRGLNDHLKLRVSLALQWVGHPVVLSDGDVLFKAEDMCGDTGFLLTHGRIELRKPGQAPEIAAAPDIIGVFPEFNPDLRWSASAIARGSAEVHRFAWLVLMRMLEQRLPGEALQQFLQQAQTFGRTHFAH